MFDFFSAQEIYRDHNREHTWSLVPPKNHKYASFYSTTSFMSAAAFRVQVGQSRKDNTRETFPVTFVFGTDNYSDMLAC